MRRSDMSNCKNVIFGIAMLISIGINPSLTSAELHSVDADGYSVLGDGENPEIVKERAIAEAKRRAIEKFGV